MLPLYLALTTCLLFVVAFVLLIERYRVRPVLYGCPPVLAASVSMAGLLLLAYVWMGVIVAAVMLG